MKRRDIIVGAAVMTASAPFVAGGAQERLKTLAVFAPPGARSTLSPALQALGWIEGRNIHIELFDLPFGDTGAMRMVAHTILTRSPDIILAGASAALSALQSEISSVPIVFVGVSDPVSQGFVGSLAKPGGRITGFANFEPSMGGKWIQLLKDVAPRTVRFAVVYNPDTASYNDGFLPSRRLSAGALGMELTVAHIHDDATADQVLASIGGPETRDSLCRLILTRFPIASGSLRSLPSTVCRPFTPIDSSPRAVAF
jgi:ABC-type uncharacterized transport system substrate-binding protein